MASPESASPELRARQVERALTHAAAVAPLTPLSESGRAAETLGSDELESRTAELVATARHLAIRTELKKLLRVWRRARIDVLVFKGFHLAEFVYPTPGLRLYSDADVLLHESDATTAARLAVRHGWQVLWHAEQPATADTSRTASYTGHEVMQLRHLRAGVHLDVHRRLVHNNHNRLSGHRRQESITKKAWAESQAIELDGVPLRQLHPADAVLIGLVLNRSWSPEDWALRPHDYLDFRYLIERFDLRPRQLQDRASELGCARTFRIFLGRCDPFSGVFNLDPPSTMERQRWNLLVAPERGNRYLERAVFALRDVALMPLELMRETPWVLEALLLARRTESLRSAVDSLAMPNRPHRELSSGRWRRIRRSVHRNLRLLGLAADDSRDLEALALLLALRRRSYPAVLSWETRADGGERPRLELDGARLNVAGTLLAD